MNSPSVVSRVVVIGGGIFGVSSAVHLTRLGVPTVLVTEGRPASGASGRSLSWLNSARSRSGTYHRLRMLGIDRYRTLSAKQPDASWLRFDGGLTWDADDTGNEIAAMFAHEKALGYDAQWLSAEEVATATPGVDTSSVPHQGAIFNPGEGWVDLSSLIDLLLTEFRARGGELLLDAGRASVNVERGRVVGATTQRHGRLGADAVLLAAGANVPAIVAEHGQSIPDDTPIALLVRTKPLRHPLRAVLNTPRVAMRPTPTGAFVFDSAWSEKEIVRLPGGGYEIADSTVRRLLAEASKVLAGTPKLELESYGAGPKPIPGDGQPVFGQLTGIPGYFVAFSHSGATLGLIAGELLAAEIAGGQPSVLLSDFRPERFREAI